MPSYGLLFNDGGQTKLQAGMAGRPMASTTWLLRGHVLSPARRTRGAAQSETNVIVIMRPINSDSAVGPRPAYKLTLRLRDSATLSTA